MDATTLFWLKILTSPLLIAGITLITRRFGPIVGGWFTALPLSSGPLSFFLTIEQGQGFGAIAACGSIQGYASMILFCVAYVLCGRTCAWWIALMIACGVFFASGTLLDLVPHENLTASVAFASALTTALLLVGLHLLKAPPPARVSTAHLAFDLPMRMTVAGIVVAGITALARLLGPTWSGILGTFPIFSAILAVFAHVQNGIGLAIFLLRGVFMGMFGSIAFFAIVALALQSAPHHLVYALALLTTFALNGLIVYIVHFVHQRRPT